MFNTDINRCQLLRKCHQFFWKQWSTEYPHVLQDTMQFNQFTTNLEVDDLIFIRPPNHLLIK